MAYKKCHQLRAFNQYYLALFGDSRRLRSTPKTEPTETAPIKAVPTIDNDDSCVPASGKVLDDVGDSVDDVGDSVDDVGDSVDDVGDSEPLEVL